MVPNNDFGNEAKFTKCAAIGNQKAAFLCEGVFRSRTYGTIRSLIAILHRSPGSRTPVRAASMIR
jgi:hypothetical protein